jgi:hypothetical protein
MLNIDSAAYAATRSDGIGDAARATGNAAIAGVSKAKEYEKEHQVRFIVKGPVLLIRCNTHMHAFAESHVRACTQVGAKVAAISSGAIAKAKEVNEKYQVVENAKVLYHCC